MASQWYRQTPDGELGPFVFAELVESVRAGMVQSDGLVRRAGQSQWQRAGDVIGLFRAARLAAGPPVAVGSERDATEPQRPLDIASRKSSHQVGRVVADAPSAISQSTTRSPRLLSAELTAGRVVGVIAGVLVAVVAAAAGWYQYREATRFPLPAGLRLQPPTEYLFFGWGPLTLAEYIVVWADACLAGTFLAYLAISWLLRTSPNERHVSSRKRD